MLRRERCETEMEIHDRKAFEDRRADFYAYGILLLDHRDYCGQGVVLSREGAEV